MLKSSIKTQRQVITSHSSQSVLADRKMNRFQFNSYTGMAMLMARGGGISAASLNRFLCLREAAFVSDNDIV